MGSGDGSGPVGAAGPAFALVGPARALVRSTAQLIDDRLLEDPAVDHILGGQLDQATLELADGNGGDTAQLEAVLDRNGARHVLVAVAGAGGGAGPTFADCLDASPAIAWLKDLEGRYLRINRRYTETFGIADDGIRGHTDAELQRRHAVDGPRLQRRGDAPDEPLQLEYTVDPFENRPALVALRFPVRGKGGEPVAVCGVAAPVQQASLAREESDRLLRIERWTRLPSEEVHAEVLKQWGLMPIANVAEADAPVAEEPIEDPSASAAVERQLAEERRRIAALREANTTAARRAHELLTELTAERTRAEELERAAEQGRVRVQELEQAFSTERQRADEAERLVTDDSSVRVQETAKRVSELEAAVEMERQRAQRTEARLAAEQDRAHKAEAAVAAERERAERAESGMAAERSRSAELASALQAERAQAQAAKLSAGEASGAADQASAGLARQRAETELLSNALKRERETASALREQLAAATHELEEARRAAEEIMPASAPAAAGDGTQGDSESAINWRPASQRTLTATLASASEWRTGLKDAIKILGSDGGWDAVAAWAPDERGRFLRCTAMWTSGDDLQAFETSTWQKPLPHFATKLGGLFTSPISTWLTDLDQADDTRLLDAARAGIRSALLVPIRDQATTIGALELLSRSQVTPDSELTASVEAVALQLGHFSHLLRESSEPRWRVGRL